MPNNIFVDMAAILGDGVPVFSAVQKWANEFGWRRGNLEDDLTSGLEAAATTKEIIECLYHMVIEDRQLL